MGDEDSKWLTESMVKLLLGLVSAAIVGGAAGLITIGQDVAALKQQAPVYGIQERLKAVEHRVDVLESGGARFNPDDARQMEDRIRSDVKDEVAEIRTELREERATLRRLEERIIAIEKRLP